MREIPLSVYLHWPEPNYVNPITRSGALLAVNIVFIILVTLSIGVRLYSRVKVKSPSGLDDIMIVLAYIFTIGMTAVVLLANRHYGWDRHMWDVRPDMIQNANIIAFVAKLMFTFASSFTRLSLIFLYYRLIRDTTIRWYTWALHFGLAFNIAVLISFIFLTVFQCVPVQAYWQFPDVINGRCLNEGHATLAAGVVNCVADLMCTILPIPAIMRLRMPLRQRIGVCALLSAGIIVTIAGIIRTYYIWKSLIDTYDETWFTYPLWICAALEVDIAVICACVPAMKTVLWKPLRRWTGNIYSQWSDSLRNSSNKPSLTSQDPIVHDTNDSYHSQYPLNSIDSHTKNPSMLEKAIAQLPSAGHLHPHHAQGAHSRNRSGDQSQQLSRTTSPVPPLGINKETSVQVSYSNSTRQKKLPKAPPAGQVPHRPRHIPLIPQGQDKYAPHTLEEEEEVIPQGQDSYGPRTMEQEFVLARHNALNASRRNSPSPPPVARNVTAPLPSLSASSRQIPPGTRRDDKKGKSFFLG